MNIRYRFLWTLVISTVATPALAEEPSVGNLIKLAPVIQSSDEKYRSIELGGYTQDDDGNVLFRFRSIYRAPDRHAVLITDGTDGTPITYASDGKLMIYDPMNGCVFYSIKANAATRIGVEDGCLRYSWHQSIDTDEPGYLRLDVKSMLDGPSRGDEVVRTGEGQYRLTRTSNSGNYYVFSIDLASKNPFQKIELVMGHTNKVRLCLDKIVIDGPLGDEQFAFPSKERLAEKITIRDWSGERLLEAVGGLGSVSRAYYARMAVKQAGVRDAPSLINLYGFSKIDWEAIQENDKKFSQSIKELVFPKTKNP